jgi:hypothetical protein
MKIKGEKKTHASGEKCATQLFTEMHVGNASPAQRERERERESIVHCMRRWTLRTFGDFDSFDRLIVYGTGTLFDEPITFDTEIEDVCALHG